MIVLLLSLRHGFTTALSLDYVGQGGSFPSPPLLSRPCSLAPTFTFAFEKTPRKMCMNRRNGLPAFSQSFSSSFCFSEAVGLQNERAEATENAENRCLLQTAILRHLLSRPTLPPSLLSLCVCRESVLLWKGRQERCLLYLAAYLKANGLVLTEPCPPGPPPNNDTRNRVHMGPSPHPIFLPEGITCVGTTRWPTLTIPPPLPTHKQGKVLGECFLLGMATTRLVAVAAAAST